MSRPVQELPSAAKASEHHVLPPFPSLPAVSHVDTKLSKPQEDSDLILQKQHLFNEWGVEKQRRGRRENSTGRGIPFLSLQ